MTILTGTVTDSALQPLPSTGKEPTWKRNLRAEMAMLGPSVQQLVWAWLLRQRSEHTAAAYGRDLREWLAWCAEHDLDPLTVRRAHGDAYGRHLEHERGLSGRSAARKLAAMSSWYTYLVEEEVLDSNRVRLANRPEINRGESSTRSLTESEARAMMTAAVHDHGRQRARTAAIIALMLTVGPRVAEVVALTMASLGYERGMRTVRIVGKGGKVRLRHLPELAGQLLDAYLATRGSTPGPVFVTASGRAMLTDAVEDLVKRIAKQAGLNHPETVTPHSLRHTFATLAQERGASRDEIQDALGHASAETTRVYLHAVKRLENDPSARVASVLGSTT
ncbi:tyrosine-type recombinase/integrase [Streptosporangium jomthongense]|uniref:Tyrosine-type recombinase/integrase n=1 Tax=Streptosporangium jomthongense TaxID=1193683 RepID=A0ABV8ETI1_9ACTN